MPSPQPLRPPRLAERLVALTAHPTDRDALLGDLAEEYARHVRPATTPARAALWYWRQAVASTLPNLARRLRSGRPRDHAPRGDRAMQTLWQDLRYAARVLRRNLAFAALAAGTLAIGIGATTIVYSVVDGVVLNPFPYPEPERLVGVGPEYPKLGRALRFWEVLSPAEYRDIERQSHTLQRVVAWDMGNRTVTLEGAEDEPERLFSAFWWGDALPTLGVRAAAGRGFTREELERGDRVAVLSHRFWRRRLGGDPAAVGRTIAVNGVPYTVIGIMPPRTLIYGTDLWIPMGVDPAVFPRTARQFQLLARLAPGATLEQANAELATIARRIEQEHGAELEEYQGWRLAAKTWTDINVSLLRPAALILLGAVAFVLLLVCVNVASLLLARSAGRRREIAVRTALGAGRGRILRQLLTESMLLAFAGGALGIVLAWRGTRALAALLLTLPVPIPGEVTLNGRVLLASAGISLLAGVLFGLAPALQAARTDVSGALKSDGAGATGAVARHRLQRVFVGVEVALALMLLVGGGLLVHSFVRLQRVDPGFDTRNVLTMRLTLPRERYAGAAVTAFFQQLSDRVAALPGVRSVAVGSHFPPVTFLQTQFSIEGEQHAGEGALPTAYVTLASDGYFRTLGIPLLRGRVPSERDTEESPLVAVINDAAARRYFPARDPIGRRITIGGRTAEVVGVVGTVTNLGLDRPPQPEIFGSVRQALGGNNQLFLIVRTAVEPRSILPLVRREVRAMDPAQPIYAVQTVDDAFATAAGPRRVATTMLTLFGAFALVLAAVGIYGVVSYVVTERTREIGLRMALGAQARAVRGMVVRQAMLPVALGGAVGLLGAVALGRAMGDILFEVSGADPLTLAAVTLVLAGAALLASWLPARRASRVDPMVALRSE